MVIDPVLDYATFLGGTEGDGFYDVAIDSSGYIYLAGWSTSYDFPTSAGAFDSTLSGNDDAFAAKFDAAGNRVYATLIGGSTAEVGSGIAVDPGGNAYLTGWRASATDFPTTPGAMQPVFGGGTRDGFVSRISYDGASLRYSSFLGGNDVDTVVDADRDASGDITVIGVTYSSSSSLTGFPGSTVSVACQHDSPSDSDEEMIGS